MFAVLLAFCVIGLGAFTRLMHAGLGCPDWPACYGHWVVPVDASISQHKAWVEMIHRYAAGTLVCCVLGVMVFSVINAVRYSPRYLVYTLLIFLLIIYQAMLGMWTVTLKLWPTVVSQHLLGGMLILMILSLIHLNSRYQLAARWHASRISFIRVLGVVGVILLVGQIGLGAWTSTHYAALSCPGFPYCEAHTWGHFDFSRAFQLATPVGPNYEGGLLSQGVRQTIHMTHRFAALVLTFYLVFLSVYLFMKHARYQALMRAVVFLLGALFLQVGVGVANVLFQLPLPLAELHNLCAALLLCAMVTVNFHVFRIQRG